MSFVVRRYWNGIVRRSVWLWIALCPPLLYAAYVLVNPDSYVVTRTLEVSPDTPVTQVPGAVSAVSAKTLVQERTLFEDEQTYWTLESRLQQEFPKASKAGIPLWSLLHDDLTMQLTDNTRLEISYRGSNRRLGEFLVDFFARRLLARTREGRLVAASQPSRQFEGTEIRTDLPPAAMVGDVRITRQRTLSDHGWALGVILLVSLLVTLVVFGAVEWSDSSFKSERQVARYLGVPVLGSLPDLDEVLDRLDDA